MIHGPYYGFNDYAESAALTNALRRLKAENIALRERIAVLETELQTRPDPKGP